MNSLKVAFITPEAVPFAKTGGLADVSGSLPISLSEMGHQVKLFMPKYGQPAGMASEAKLLDMEINCRVGEWFFEADIYYLKDRDSNLEYYFIGNEFLYDRNGLYIDPHTGKDYSDNDERFIFFSRAVLETLIQLDWPPDILHAHDWQSALIPTFTKTLYKESGIFKDARTVFTIHNMGYQGLFPAATFKKLEIDDNLLYPAGPFEFWGKINFMKSAIHYSDFITTVSPTYAREIQESDEYGKGLHGVLKERSDSLTGIINGVDYDLWSPQKDKLIPYRYHPANFSGKKKNKLELLHQCGFPLRTDQPLIGIISRLDRQKGFDLLEEIFDDIMSLDLQIVLLGTGDEVYHNLFSEAEAKYPDRFRAYLKFDNKLAHLIEAGADIFMMPSRYEPCGLNQLYSLKYGTVPVVRKTGGLADSVKDFEKDRIGGNGFVFEEYDSEALLDVIKKAVYYFGKRKVWYKIMKNGMAADFSWKKSAMEYYHLYSSVSMPQP